MRSWHYHGFLDVALVGPDKTDAVGEGLCAAWTVARFCVLFTKPEGTPSIQIEQPSRNDLRLAHSLKRRRITFHGIDALLEPDLPRMAEVVLPVEVEDRHDEVQERP